LGSVRFFRTKTSSNRFGLSFFGLSSVQFCFFGLSLVQFGFFGLGSVWFFRFQTYKIETELVSVFKILIGFFHGLVFSVMFFWFFKFNRFFGFFTHYWFLQYWDYQFPICHIFIFLYEAMICM
jgi:hypothetical protein